MNANVKDLEEAALHLSVQDRAHLAQKLLESLDLLPEAEARQLWLTEAEKRAKEIDEGNAQLISDDDFEKQVKTRFK